MSDSPIVRRTVLYSGRVQGVGFRARTQSLARKRPVTGTVRNLPNGQVEVVVEGEELAVDGFLAAVAEWMSDGIVDIQTTSGAPTGEWNGFSIVR